MPQFIEFFLMPVRDNVIAQVLIFGLLILGFLDLAAGGLTAWFIQHDFKSSIMRAGFIKKIINLIIVIASIVIDAIVLTGISPALLPFKIPDGSVVVIVTLGFVTMELISLLEIAAECYPEVMNSVWWQMLATAKGEKGDDE